MDFRLLGPLEADLDGHSISVRARALLALLLLHRNEVLMLDRIVDELWPERPPKTAGQVVRVYVSQLRKALEPERSDGSPQILVTRGSGYLIRVGPEELDLDRFDSLRAEGRRLLVAGDFAQAAEALDRALSLWRGRPLQDFAYETFAQPEIARLDELRLATLEDLFDARLAEGHDSELVADLDHLVEANPLRERLRGQLMVALYRSGRQADALEIYQRGRRHLVDELGLEPSEGLRRLEARILQQDPALERPSAALPTKEPDGAPRRSRRLALVGTTAFILAAIAAGILIATTGPTAGRPAAASLRVALVANELRSQSLTDSSRQGVDPIDGLHVAAEEDGVRARILYGGPSATRFLKTVAAAARTSDFVIVEATPELEALSRLTRRFPNTQFFVPDTVLDPLASFRGQKNVTGANFDDRENGYLGGYLAGLMAPQHGSVSAVGGIPTQSVRDLVAGFSRGARSARPGIRVRVDYSGTFVDQAPCEKLANRQIDRGSAVVFDVAGNCGIGAVAAAGIRGVWALGVDSDMSSTNSQVLASVVKHFDRATQLAVTLFATGRLPGGQDLRLDLSSGGIGLVGINSRVPQGVRVKVEAVAAQLRARDQAPGAR